MSHKLALVIGNTEYEDAKLSQLVSPQADALALAEVLRSRDIGQFDEVKTLINETESVVSREVVKFFGGDNKAEDLLLLYFSGHGVRDDRGRLYLAVADTELDLLGATALPASLITEAMDRSLSRRQVLVLDCCHSGAFERGAKGMLTESVGTQIAFEGASAFRAEGPGRVVLTATDAAQYAWEGDHIVGEAERSVFTHFLVEGLRTGDADLNQDGWISIDELYDYVHRQVVSRTPRQVPCKFAHMVKGEFVIGRRPPGSEKAVILPPELVEEINSRNPAHRLDAVQTLIEWLRGSHIGRGLAAEAALKEIAAEDDSTNIRRTAERALVEYGSLLERRPGGETAPTVISTVPSRNDPQPAPTVEEGELVRKRWMEWAVRELGDDALRAEKAVEAALIALSRGADSDAAALAGREAARSRGPIPGQLPHAAAPASSQAIAALVIGVLSVPLCPLAAPIAIGLGISAHRAIKASGGRLSGAGLAKLGILFGVVAICFWAGLIFYFALISNQSPTRVSS